MARYKLPDRPPNGSGAGERPRLVPRPLNLQRASTVLSKPFSVPYKRSRTAQDASPRGAAAAASSSTMQLRKRARTVSYAGLDVEIPKAEEQTTHTPRKRPDALSSSRLMRDSQRLAGIETALKRSFAVPIPGYISHHSLPLTLGTKRKVTPEPRPLHDPTDEFAIVLYDPSVDGDMILQDSKDCVEELPSQSDQTKITKSQAHRVPRFMTNGVRNKTLAELLGTSNPTDSKGATKFPNVPVVIDPHLAKILRPHQVEGVKFLYRCVTGLVMKDFLDAESVNSSNIVHPKDDQKDNDSGVTSAMIMANSVNRGAYGCIMADEMGLGKTLQCIALLWTLLRQGPQGKKLIEKCIIVCPSSLVNNWANELVKWLGPNTLSPLAVDGKKSSIVNGGNATVADAVKKWAQASGRNIVKPVLIISYETLRRNVDQLQNCQVGLLLADEGHRLKNGDSLTFTALDSIKCPRRVILSGTPIQNDLSEYFALLNFSNPGLLGTRLEFRKNFEIPILRGRDAEATDTEISKGERQLQQLSNIVSKFIIRRTNDILSKYLPCKYEHVIFVGLTPLQTELYKKLIKSREMKKAAKGDNGSQPLKAIGVLKKLCTHPNLLNFDQEVGDVDDFQFPDDFMFPSSKSRDIQTKYSAKFCILERFLYKIKKESDDKIVLISNYTQTLDLIEKMCRSRQYGCVRLDGTMNINKRQKLVDRFNDPEGQEFIFLLSSKAGGCGINLIGANRLILLDPDWNPAADQQALARVWRDGQKKDCFIYRFISTGTIEEKIFQRQSMKLSLSSCVVDAKEDVERLFSADNLRHLFNLNEDTICDTHETYNCKRCSKSGKQHVKAPAMLYGDATTWNHLNHDALEKTNDHLLKNEFNHPDITFAFQYISH